VTAKLVGAELTVDGSAGVVYRGILATEAVDPASVPGVEKLIEWAREASPVEVVADAGEGSIDPEAVGTSDDVSTPEGARAAIAAGVTCVPKLPGQHEAALLLRFAQEKSNLEHEEEESS
jgi:pyruvate,orthophosphate dikinase